MNRAHTQVQRHSKAKAIQRITGFRSAVSLHSHTHHSKENLGFLPHYVEFLRTQFLTRMLQSGLRNYESTKGKSLDFRRAYWTPPVTPGMVFASETEQIERKLGLPSLVSITDHDTIDGPLSLKAEPATASMPISVEWTVPFGGNTFHLGIHHLPPDCAHEIMEDLAQYTTEPVEDRLGDLFARLDRCPDTLLVLNHPLFSLGRDKHLTSLRRLLSRCRPWIHALEFNGMRSWTENKDVLHMAEEYDLPVVAGGDRHGRRPGAVLNLTHGETWSDFVGEIRQERQNTVLVMPAYEEPAVLREFATASDVLRHYPYYPYGQRRFTDRIFFNMEGYGWHPLSFYWDGGKGRPGWLTPTVAAVIALGSDHLRPLLGWLLSCSGQFDRVALPKGDDDTGDGLGRHTEIPVEPE